MNSFPQSRKNVVDSMDRNVGRAMGQWLGDPVEDLSQISIHALTSVSAAFFDARTAYHPVDFPTPLSPKIISQSATDISQKVND